MNYENILFDLDGTLTDAKQGILNSIQHALKSLDRPVPHTSELLWCIGPPLSESFNILLNEENASVRHQALALYRERYDRIGKFENLLYPQIPMMLSLLCQSGCRLFLATAKPLVFARQIIGHFSLRGYFAELYGSRLDGGLSHKPDLIAAILAREALRPERTIMVGDRMQDINGARACGIKSLAVTYGYGSLKEIREAGADFTAQRPMDIFNQIIGGTAPDSKVCAVRM